jgi:hypothetical protein
VGILPQQHGGEKFLDRHADDISSGRACVAKSNAFHTIG